MFFTQDNISTILLKDKDYNIHSVPFSGKASDWEQYHDFVPKEGDMIIFTPDAEVEEYRIKIGNGTTPLGELEFIKLSGSNAPSVNIPTKVSELENDLGYLTEHQSLDGYITSETATAINYGMTTPGQFANGEVFLTPLGGDPATKQDIEKIAASYSLFYGKISNLTTDEEIDAALNALYNDATFTDETFRYYTLACNSETCAIEKGVYLMEIYKQSYRFGYIVIRRAGDKKFTEYKRIYRGSVLSAWKDCSISFEGLI